MPVKVTIAIILLLFLMSSCVTNISGNEYRHILSKRYKVNFKDTWNAVNLVMQNDQYVLINKDEESRLLSFYSVDKDIYGNIYLIKVNDETEIVIKFHKLQEEDKIKKSKAYYRDLASINHSVFQSIETILGVK
ncbi:MAG: hypothetical protein ACJAUP_002231 [Cellvibrionaceae bacterium]|jgi:hypothetical protein